MRVYCEQQPIAATTFTFYQHMHMPPSDMILQILSSQLQSHFPGQPPMGGSGNSGSGGQVRMHCMHLHVWYTFFILSCCLMYRLVVFVNVSGNQIYVNNYKFLSVEYWWSKLCWIRSKFYVSTSIRGM